MICPICGHDTPENSGFCENCGNPMHRPAPFSQPQPTPVAPDTAPQPTQALPGKTMGLVGLILGICSIVFSCCVFYLALPGGIAGIILSAISMKKAKDAARKNNLALAGLICSIVGTVLACVAVFFVILLLIYEL